MDINWTELYPDHFFLYTKEGEQEVPVNVTLPEGYELVDEVTVRVNLTPSAERQSEE